MSPRISHAISGLKKAGYEVAMAASGAEAVEKLKALAYDLLITDLLMEEITGIDVMRVAKELHPAIKTVVNRFWSRRLTCSGCFAGGRHGLYDQTL